MVKPRTPVVTDEEAAAKKCTQVEHCPSEAALPSAGFLCYQEQARRAELIGLLIERTEWLWVK